MSDAVKKALQAEADRLSKKYGDKSGALGSTEFRLDVVPTGILALDYALGTGGWPLGHPVEVFGAPDIGKTSTLGLSAFRSAQAQGLTTGLIALEPGFDPKWAVKNGVDPELLIVARPDDGGEAFEILWEWMTGDVVDFVIFDSIGAVTNPGDHNKADAANKVGGASNLITFGIRRIVQPVWKKNKGLIFLNQQRQKLNSPIPGMMGSPGGEALKHFCDIRIQLKGASGKETLYKEKIDGEDVIVGRKLTAHIVRNKMHEGTNVKAQFDYYQRDTVDQVVGIDTSADVIATGMRTGVIKKAGAYYRHRTFPLSKGGDNQCQGKDGVADFLADNPEAIPEIRKDVIEVMLDKYGAARSAKPDLEAIDRAIAEENEDV